MTKFKSGDRANVLTRGGELTVKIISEELSGYYTVMLLDENGLHTGRTEHMEASRLMPLRGPYFDIRGQVLTTSLSHPGEVGEIVGSGSSKTRRVLYKIKFSDGAIEWFHEDQVFIDDEVKRAHDETAKENEFFQ
jgi:hypothetical protein